LAAQQALWLIQPAESEAKVDNPGSTTGEPTSPSISKIAIEPFQ
jgi:hypothetical protein